MSILDTLITKQSYLYKLLNSTIDNIKALDKAEVTRGYLETRVKILENTWVKFQSNQEKILSTRLSDSALKLPYFSDNTFEQGQETYASTKGKLITMLDKFEHSESIPGSKFIEASGSDSRRTPSLFQRSLPRIQLPSFSGDYKAWKSFHDLFSSMIGNNPDLSPIEKFHYLKLSVEGEAEQLLSNIMVSSENFVRAWDILVNRYENKRLLLKTHLDRLFNIPVIMNRSAPSLKLLLSSVKDALGSLSALGAPTEHWDYMIVYLIICRLDTETHEAWELHRGTATDLASLTTLEQFIEGRIRALENMETRNTPNLRNLEKRINTPKSSVKVYTTGTVPNGPSSSSSLTKIQIKSHQACTLCKESHYLGNCTSYRELSIGKRYEHVSKSSLCFNCLGAHHLASCSSPRKCQLCNLRHHTTLHGARIQSSPSKFNNFAIPSPAVVSVGTVNALTSTFHAADPHHVVKHPNALLGTARVRLYSPNGHQLNVRTLIDPGSQISIISERAVQKLRLKRRHASLPLSGVGAVNAGTTKGIVSFVLKPYFDSKLEWDVNAYILPKPTAELPAVTLTCEWQHLKEITLADPDFLKSGSIDLIIGIELYSQIIEAELMKGPRGSPFARRTGLGWVISGPVGGIEDAEITLQNSTSNHLSLQSLQCSVNYDLYEALQRFWVQEEIQKDTEKTLTSEEAECENHFLDTHRRDINGRYIVRLPFKETPERLGSSRGAAAHMLNKTLKRLSSDNNMKNLYTNFLLEYESLGHMVQVNDYTLTAKGYYLPHHGVLKESSSSTKLRVVFNGSCRTDKGTSLNDILYTGAKLQTDLTDVITWWRQFQYGFSADMEKMFRQIKLQEDDCHYQKVLWSRDLSSNFQTFFLTTVTYGLASAPFLANRVINQLACDEEHRFPEAAQILRKGTYVDDCFGGSYSLIDANNLANQLDSLCKAGGFNLMKWASNHDGVLKSISANRLTTSALKHIEDESIIKTLGIAWNTKSDCFTCTLPWNEDNEPLTKRKILSKIAHLFDPLGWLAPITIRAKVFMQNLWLLKTGWDETLPQSSTEQWLTFLRPLKDISFVSVPRWIGISPTSHSAELHGFSDASQDAMAAVVYLRIQSDSNEIHVSLLGAKTKVAPLKKMTIPRLELGAALLLTKLSNRFINSLSLQSASIHLWTDSTVALAWIQAHPSRWKDFVRNRVVTIQETLPQAQWHHISGKENPADCASRGITAQQLTENSLWLYGPPWLRDDVSSWPSRIQIPIADPDSDLEEKIRVLSNVSVQICDGWELLQRYSSLPKLLRVTVMCFRAVLRFKGNLNHSSLTSIHSQELIQARLYWTQNVQKSYFHDDTTKIAQGLPLSKNNPLLRLSPFVDTFGILRVGGRLRNSLLDPDTKHPIILPKESYFTQLIIQDAHLRSLHGGTQTTLAYIRRSYWILGGRRPVRSFILKCVRCTRYRGEAAKQLMGQLPPARVIPTRPFLNSGIDYAGPFQFKTWRGRAAKQYKGYIALFICLATSAIHLEAVTDYTTEGFISAFKRFTGRRGICSTLSSDCGTNLIGADIQLFKLFSSSCAEINHLKTLLANDGTEWRFIPPSAPHFGGKWEAGVKSVKFHLKRVIGNMTLTFEEFTTLLCQIEAVVNSRPLCPISDDPDDIDALTPGHFLIGSSMTSLPEPSLVDVKMNKLTRWQLNRQMLEHFWNRWSREYLQRLITLTKWQHSSDTLTEGKLVLIIDERYPPSKWPLARIVSTHPGADGIVRVVTLKTKIGILKRPIVKLCILPI